MQLLQREKTNSKTKVSTKKKGKGNNDDPDIVSGASGRRGMCFAFDLSKSSLNIPNNNGNEDKEDVGKGN